ncbi:hypothetical protein ACFYNW_34670 [Streptomyces virginiae]|uniref:hypothetical protein n=1 Tax=Streptomyces virginiae TaxID=1961 RepID=UPI0036E558D4
MLPPRERSRPEAGTCRSPSDAAGRLAFDDAYKAFGPKRIEQLVREDPSALLGHAEAIEAEITKVQRDVEAAKKAAQKALGSDRLSP